MKNKTLLWLIAATFAIGVAIDFIDGYIPKLVSSLAITLALIFFAVGIGNANQKKFNVVAYGLLGVAIIALIYRLLKWYNVV